MEYPSSTGLPLRKLLVGGLLQLLEIQPGSVAPGFPVEVLVDDGWWRTRVHSATAADVTAPVGLTTNIVSVPWQVKLRQCLAAVHGTQVLVCYQPKAWK
jgi:hypothetical protein